MANIRKSPTAGLAVALVLTGIALPEPASAQPQPQATYSVPPQYRALTANDVRVHFATQQDATQPHANHHVANREPVVARSRQTRSAAMRSSTMRSSTVRSSTVRSSTMHSPHASETRQPPVMHFRETADRSESRTGGSSDDVNVLFAKELQAKPKKRSMPPMPSLPASKLSSTNTKKRLVSVEANPNEIAQDIATARARREAKEQSDAMAMLLPKRGELSASADRSSRTSPFQLTQKTGIGLGIALSAFFGLVWLLRKTGGSTQSSGAIPQQVVQVLGRAPLNTRQNMQLVRLGDKILLLAISTTGTESLGEISDRDEVDAITEICLSRNTRRIKETFRQTLQRVRDERGLRREELRSGSYAV